MIGGVTIQCIDECGKTGNPIWFDQMQPPNDFVPRDRTFMHFLSTGKCGCKYNGNPIVFIETMQQPYAFVIKDFLVYEVVRCGKKAVSGLILRDQPCGKLRLDCEEGHYYHYVGKQAHGFGPGCNEEEFCTFMNKNQD